MTSRPSYRKKLIEVDLPLDAINVESKREKSSVTVIHQRFTCGGRDAP